MRQESARLRGFLGAYRRGVHDVLDARSLALRIAPIDAPGVWGGKD
jgi:hypothetical protein